MEQGDLGGQYEAGMSSRGAAALRDFGRPMSAQGQTQKSECATGKSALPSTTGIVSQTCQVRKVPILLQKSKIERPGKSRES